VTLTQAERLPEVPTLPNLRDVGGLETAAGRLVRTGLLYRSTALNNLDGPGAEAFARLGIRTIYDLRTASERAEQPDHVPPGVDYVVADMLSDADGRTPGQMMESLTDPAVALEAFGDGKGAAMFVVKYREFVGLESARRALGRLFTDLAEERRRPALIHCTTGKDRTGWAAASLLLWLGVPAAAVERDYLASNEQLRPAFQAMLDDFVARGGRPGLLDAFIGVLPEYLESALAEMRRLYGTVESYFADGLALDGETRAALRAAFLGRD
jgi:protein-tyrosine phosphatase